jgi:hypothetical protein
VGPVGTIVEYKRASVADPLAASKKFLMFSRERPIRPFVGQNSNIKTIL